MANASLNNYTVTSVVYTAVSGSNVYTSHPTAVLTITPDTGYTVTSTDFSWINTTLNYINTVVFTQSGANVLCTVTFDNPFSMPASNVDLALCISGAAIKSKIELSGTFSVYLSSGTNTGYSSGSSPIPEAIPFTYSDIEGTTIELFTRTYTVDSGWAIPQIPEIEFSGSDMVSSNYTVTNTTVSDSDNNLTSVTVAISYTFPSTSVVDDSIKIKIEPAFELVTEAIKITSYAFDTSNLCKAGDIRKMKVYGSPTAKFTLSTGSDSILDTGTWDEPTDTYATSLTNKEIPSSGYYEFAVKFPAVTSNDVYTFTFSGTDLQLTQPNPFYVYQYDDATLTFNTTGSNLQVTASKLNENSIALASAGAVTRTAEGNTFPAFGSEAYKNNIEWTVTTTGTQIMSLVADPTVSWTNLAEAETYTTAAVSNSTTLPVTSNTGIANSMRITGFDITGSGTPPGHVTVSNVSGTNITASNAQTLGYVNSVGVLLTFSNTNGSEITLPALATLDTAETTATVKVFGTIDKYGDADQTFTLDLTSLLTVGSSAACTTYTLVTGTDGGTLTFNTCGGESKTQSFLKGLTVTLCINDLPAPSFSTTGASLTKGSACSGDSDCFQYTITYNPTSRSANQTVFVKYWDCRGGLVSTNFGVGTSTFCGNYIEPVITDATNQATWSRNVAEGHGGC